MTTNFEGRILRRFDDMLGKLSAISQALVQGNRQFAQFSADAKEANTFVPVDPMALKPRYEIGMDVVVFKEGHLREGWRGTIQEMYQASAVVVLTDGTMVHLQGHEMIPLHEKPYVVRNAKQLEIPEVVAEPSKRWQDAIREGTPTIEEAGQNLRDAMTEANDLYEADPK